MKRKNRPAARGPAPSSPDSERPPRRPRARTSSGQHYLANGQVMTRIAGAARVTPDDTVVEIGAGPGNLTRRLAETGARVVAVESDRRFEPNLVHLMRELPNVIAAWTDALDLDWDPLWNETPVPRRVIVGNIPYQITAPLLGRLTDQRHAFARAILMVQLEVADRLVAGPGTRVRGALSVKAQLDFAVKKLFRVSPRSFRPAPKVTSAVVEITPLGDPPVASEAERALVRRLVEAAFGARRQQVINALTRRFAPSRPKSAWMELLGEAEIEPSRRAETLATAEFITLSRAVQKTLESED